MVGGSGTPHPVITTLSNTTLGSVPVALAPSSLKRNAVVDAPVVAAAAVLPVYQVFFTTGVKSSIGVAPKDPPSAFDHT